MLARFSKNRFGPIGVDIGSRSVKLVQFTADGTRLIDASKWDLPAGEDDGSTGRYFATAEETPTYAELGRLIADAFETRRFRARRMSHTCRCVSERPADRAN